MAISIGGKRRRVNVLLKTAARTPVVVVRGYTGTLCAGLHVHDPYPSLSTKQVNVSLTVCWLTTASPGLDQPCRTRCGISAFESKFVTLCHPGPDHLAGAAQVPKTCHRTQPNHTSRLLRVYHASTRSQASYHRSRYLPTTTACNLSRTTRFPLRARPIPENPGNNMPMILLLRGTCLCIVHKP